MSEKFKFSSKQDRADNVDEIHDFVAIDALGKARVPTGSGRKSGKFLSDHEIKMIAAHTSEIYDGLDNRENEAMIDAVGVLEKPKHIRKSLEQHGFIDEDDDWTNTEIKDMVEDARKDVDVYYASHGSAQEAAIQATSDDQPAVGKHRADVADAPSQAEGYVRIQDRLEGRHRSTEVEDGSDSPLYDRLLAKYKREALAQAASENESLEEYEARHTGGRHLAPLPTASLEALARPVEPLPTDSLEAIARPSVVSAEQPGVSPLPTDSLAAIARGTNGGSAEAPTQPVQPEATQPRSRLRRAADWLRPSGSGAAAGLVVHAEQHRRNASERERGKRGRLAAIIGGVAVVSVGTYLGFRYGSDIRDIFDGPVKHPSPNPADHGDGKGQVAKKAHELFGNGRVEVHQGDGYTQVLERVLAEHDVHLSPRQLYDLHQHLESSQGDYIDLHGAHDTYTMANGDSGLTHGDGNAHVSEATQKAIVRWLQSHDKLAA